MICPNCKKELPNVGFFCGYCGAALEPESKEEALSQSIQDQNEQSNNEIDDVGTVKADSEADDMSTVMANSDEIDDIRTVMANSDEIDDTRTVMANNEDIVASRSNSVAADNLENKDRNRNASSSKKIAPNNASNVRQPKNPKKEKKHSKGNLASKRIAAVFKIAVLAIIIIGSIGILSFRFWDDAKNKDWIVRLEELESTQKSENGGVLNTYQLDGEFERMSVKAVSKQSQDSLPEHGTKLLQIWIDDSLVYEVEAGESDKKEWTFAIDLRGVSTMTILTASQTTLDDVQIIRQSAEKKTESEAAKETSRKTTTKINRKKTDNKETSGEK